MEILQTLYRKSLSASQIADSLVKLGQKKGNNDSQASSGGTEGNGSD